jgi:tetratricopeptide (TPR) repeat protein
VTPAGGLYSTLRDLFRFDRALHDTTLLSAASKERLFATRSVITAYGWKTSEEERPNGTRRKILRTTGGLPGFAALLYRIPSEERVILLLANTRDLEWRFDDFATTISRILDGEAYTMPKRSAAEELAAALRSGARGDALRARFAAMRRDTATYAVSESALNRLGYFLLYNKRLPVEAVTVFEANVAAFPRSANVYDSLGEALMVRGDTTRAVANYRQSLALDPQNTNATEMLKRLGAQ